MKIWNNIPTDFLKDPAFAKKVEKLEPEYELLNLLIKARIENKMTQSELARKVGTKQSNISRLESGA